MIRTIVFVLTALCVSGNVLGKSNAKEITTFECANGGCIVECMGSDGKPIASIPRVYGEVIFEAINSNVVLIRGSSPDTEAIVTNASSPCEVRPYRKG